MKPNWAQFIIGFLVIYHLLLLGHELPVVVNGGGLELLIPDSWGRRLLDMLLGLAFAAVPFAVLLQWYARRKYINLITAGVVMLTLVFFLSFWVEQVNTRLAIRLRYFFQDHLFFFVSYTLFGLVWFFVRYTYFKEWQQRELLLQNRQAELAFLRSQINPHFLFNSLNNIYALVYEGSAKALPAIAGLSDLLRYMLYDTTEQVPLQKELDYIARYIELQQLRFPQPAKVDLHISGAVDKGSLPPLLLIPFVENAFKHGDLGSGGSGLYIRVDAGIDELVFECRNEKGRGNKDSGGGIGLSNIRRRLDLIYPGQYQLEITDRHNTFTVNLRLRYGTN